MPPATIEDTGDNHPDYSWKFSPSVSVDTVSSAHAYRPLLALEPNIVDQWLEPHDLPERRAYRCIWPGCFAKLPRNKYNARLHAHKHLGANKLFECVTCGQRFMSEANAKRHRDNRNKVFQCDFCAKKYARKDYCQAHSIKCPKRKK
ncbi:hypothetical protein K439DRAFT_936446 [Ramaria rubella]|nr:hypothetical protein K439DRAFT_936446 [Ramaria rubella]